MLILLCILPTCGISADKQLHSQNLTDRYRWMETDRDRTNQWLQQRTKQAIERIDVLPLRASVAQQFNALVGAEDTLSDFHEAGEKSFYLQSTPEFPYQRLFVKQKNDQIKLLVDPPVGMGIHFFSPSHNGRYVAYGLSENGSEITTIEIMDVISGTVLQDRLPNVRYPRIAWRNDNRSFFYTRLPLINNAPSASERLAGEKVFLHHIGQHEKTDEIVFDINMIPGLNADVYDSVALYSSPNSDWLLASLSPAISGYSSSIFAVRAKALDGRKTPWEKIIDSDQKVSFFIFSGEWLYLARYNSSSGYLISRLALNNPHVAEEKILEWSQGELTGLATSSEALYITWHNSGTRRFTRVAFDNIQHPQEIPLPFSGEVTALFSSLNQRGLLFTLQDWTTSAQIFRYDPDAKTVNNTNLIHPARQDFSDYEVKEVWVTSTNQVRVPLTIIHRRGIELDGSAPTWLTAYGAYGVSTLPNYDPWRLIWLRNGGVMAIAHVRGGGELGPAWHEAGRLENKENSITDFIKCAEYLINEGYTRPAKLVVSGSSAGGITIGIAVAQRPELFAAAAVDAGILNTSELDKIPIGPMNFEEFGSPSTAEGMRNLRKIDAYQNLHDGIRYPAMLLTVGLNDDRVSPWQSAKFAARLEEIAGKIEGARPVLIFAEKNAGHSSSTYAQSVEKYLDTVSFFLWQTSDSTIKK